MTDWIYVIGEGSYNQDFIILNQATSEPLPLSGVITMFITKSDYSDPIPDANGQVMSIEINPSGFTVARLAVTAIKMPTEAGIYLAQIKIDAAATLKTYFINLRVIRSITN